MKCLKFVLLLLLFSNSSWAQTDISWCLEEYPNADIERKVELFYFFEGKFRQNFPDSILYYVNDLQTEGYDQENEGAIIMANIGMARYLLTNSLYSEAKVKMERVLAYYENIENDSLTAFSYNMLGNINFFSGRISEAEINYNRSLESAKKTGKQAYNMMPLINLATVYNRQGKNEEAMEMVNRCIDYYTVTEEMKKLSDAYGLKGSIYLGLEEYEKAKEVFMTGMEYAQSSGDLEEVANGYTNMAIAEYYSSRVEESEKYFRLALTYRQKVTNKYYLSQGYYNLGDFYFGIEKYDSAVNNYWKSIEVAEFIKNSSAKLDALVQLNELYLELDQPSKRIDILDQIVEVQSFINKDQSEKTTALLNKSAEQDRNDMIGLTAIRERKMVEELTTYQMIFKQWIWILFGVLAATGGILFFVSRRKKKNILK